MQKIRAFTLAEVLITLGVIGVVAAMTIPTLLNNSQKSEDFSKLKKAISVISDAASSIRAENGGDFSNLAYSVIDFVNLFKPYLKVIKSCAGSSDSENCYIKNTDKVYTLGGISYGGVTTNHYFYDGPKVVTTDGFVYWFEFSRADCSGTQHSQGETYDNCGSIYVDINGKKLPNTFGKDIFKIQINKYNVTPRGDGGASYCSKTNTSDIWNGGHCAGMAIMHGAIDYY